MARIPSTRRLSSPKKQDMQEEYVQGTLNSQCKNQSNEHIHAIIFGPAPKCRKLLSSSLKEVAPCVSDLKNLVGSLKAEEEQDNEFHEIITGLLIILIKKNT